MIATNICHHASFGGLGLGFFLGMNPVLMAMVFSVLSAFGVEWASRTQNIREDSAIAGVWSLGMALGVIFIFLTPGYAPNLSAYLFGNILTITMTDIIAIAALVIVLIGVFSLFLRKIIYVAFDRDFAMSRIRQEAARIGQHSDKTTQQAQIGQIVHLFFHAVCYTDSFQTSIGSAL